MSRWFFLVVGFYALFLMGGCPNNRSVQYVPPVEARPLPTGVEDLKKHVAQLRDELARGEIALAHAKEDAIQVKIWIGVGACCLAGLVLVALGIWTTRRVLVEIGLAAFGLAALGVMAAWLVPYIFWIGLAVAVIVIGVVIYMLVNRERAVKQIGEGVSAAAERIPEFDAQFRRIFNEHIDTNIDKVIKTVRGVT